VTSVTQYQSRKITPKPAPTLAQMAKNMGIPRRTVLRRLHLLHALDAQRGRRPWLFRFGKGPWRVNASILRRYHAELFDHTPIDEIEDRLTRLERTFDVLNEAVRKLVRWAKEK